MNKTLVCSAILALVSSGQSWANSETEALKKLIEAQQQQLEILKKRLDDQEQKIDVTADAVEDKTSQAHSDTTIGGYGELHYTNQGNKDTLDFHRFVLFFGHRFNDRLRLFSELEVEHSVAKDGGKGEVEVEQAYIEYDLNQTMSVRAGSLLVPVGILNETHEPITFYGVERNLVEKDIIPTTWFEGGVGLTYRPAPGWTLDSAITGGLNVQTTGGNAYKIRNGRTQVASAKAENFAFTGRVKYTAIPGLELAASLQYQDDVTQGNDKVSATLFSTHGIYQKGPFAVRALYARWDLKSDAAKLMGRDIQEGYYVEPSYKLNEKLGLFARYSEWNNESGLSSSQWSKQTSYGLNYWLDAHVVLKMDWDSYAGALDGDGFNLGMGYQF